MNKIIKLLEKQEKERETIPNEIHRHAIHLIDLEYALKLAYIDVKYWRDITWLMLAAVFVIAIYALTKTAHT